MKAYASIFAVALLFAVSPAKAQLGIGGVIGLNVATIEVDPKPISEEYSSRFGFGIGVVLDAPLPVSTPVDLHAEPMILLKGAKIEEGGDEVAFKVTYLELPVMIRYNIEEFEAVQPYVIVGPSLGLMLSSKFDVKDGPEIDAKDDTKSIDFGVGFGAGVMVPRNNMRFFGEFRYVLGLANINDDADDNTNVKNRGLQILIGAMLPGR